jgi:DNA-binding NtrC family response regulator
MVHQILFVDQDERSCEAMGETLRSIGHQVISACCPDESLSLAKIGMFDLYLFGRLFPKSSSMELCRQIRAFDEETPMLFYFDSRSGPARDQAAWAGRRGCFTQAIDQRALTRAISPLLADRNDLVVSRPAIPENRFTQSKSETAIIVLGDCRDVEPVHRYIKVLPLQTVVMANGPRAAGTIAETAARRRGLAIRALPIDWRRVGRRASWQRNRRLVEYADRIALFWDQRNQEALGLLRFAQKLGKSVEMYTL